MLRNILEKSFSILLNLSTIIPKLFWVTGDLRPSLWGWTKSEGYAPLIISFQHSWLVSVSFLYRDGKGTNVSGTLDIKLYSSLRKGSHIQLSLVIQVTRGGRKMPFRPLNCGERNPSQLYHSPPLVDSCLSTYCMNTQRENSSSLGEMQRKGIGKPLLTDYLMNISHPNLTFYLLHWPKTNRPEISPAKMSFLRVSRELQFGICNQGEPHVSPHSTMEGTCFYREGKDGGRL